MADCDYDILIIGATGYTGRLVIEYLANHSSAPSFRIALGGRTLSKVEELARKYKKVASVYIDVSKADSVLAAVAKTRVVINLAGPYWTYGSNVVRACALHGVHYVDLTGEAPWIAKIIQDHDYLAYKNHACIIPCSGYDSIPSDLAAYLSVQALENHLLASGLPASLDITSTAAHRVRGGISGGTAASIFSAIEEVPREKRANGRGWGLSPIPGPTGFSALPGLLYSLPRVRPAVYGGFFFMSPTNEPVVRRSWGLRERQRREEAYKAGAPARRSTFAYTEFMATPNRIFGVALSLTIFTAAVALTLLPPVRWLLRKVLPASGEGPSVEALDKGWFEVTNVAEAGDVAVKTVVKGNGDPGYRLTSIMIVESAMLLLDTTKLTPLTQQGGILTPTAAFGDKLAQALEGTGRFQTSIEVLRQEEARKTR